MPKSLRTASWIIRLLSVLTFLGVVVSPVWADSGIWVTGYGPENQVPWNGMKSYKALFIEPSGGFHAAQATYITTDGMWETHDLNSVGGEVIATDDGLVRVVIKSYEEIMIDVTQGTVGQANNTGAAAYVAPPAAPAPTYQGGGQVMTPGSTVTWIIGNETHQLQISGGIGLVAYVDGVEYKVVKTSATDTWNVQMWPLTVQVVWDSTDYPAKWHYIVQSPGRIS